MMTNPRCYGLLLIVVCITLALVASIAAAGEPASAGIASTFVYFGTYTGGKSKGIYVSRLDLSTGALSEPELAAETINPSFLAIAPGNKFLYAVGEVISPDNPAGVSAFAIDAATGHLKLLNRQPSGGRGPCFVFIDNAGRNALVANYGSGTIAVLPIGEDGQLKPPSCTIQHQGKGANPKRQEGPHAHSIHLDAANRFAVAMDLGIDRIMLYRFDAARGLLTPNDPPAVVMAPGSGPRHFAFHPTGRFAYVINEMANTVTAFTYDAQRGTLSEIQTLPTLPADFKGESTTAEVQVLPNGRTLYGSNRGHDSIAIFEIDGTGKLGWVGAESSGGKTPRNFGIDPTGQYLLAANQDSDSVVVYRIDRSGRLSQTRHSVAVGKPVCVKFLPVSR